MSCTKCNCPTCPDEPEYQCCKGDTGAQGLAGPQGETGATGPKGQDGQNGLQGPVGPRGEEGCQGDRGATGQTGSIGPAGQQGPRGEQGNEGPAGPKGNTGERGVAGDQGSQGLTGDTGAKGDIGDTGPQGDKGDTGDTGPRGDKGDKGDTGDVGPPGQNGANGATGVQGDRGPSGFNSCTFDDTRNCYDVELVLSDGSTKQAEFSGCVSLLACGYAGNPICATAATGTIEANASNDVFTIPVTYTIGGATLTSEIKLTDTIASGTTQVSNVRFEGGRLCVDITTSGKLAFRNIYDKTNMPKTPEGCTSPLSGEMEIAGLVLGSGQATQINKTSGGLVAQNGFDDIGNSTWNVLSDSNSWIDTVQPQLFGGVPGADIGANFGSIVDTFGANEQTYTLCESVCYYEPVEYETDVSGNPIAGTGVDAQGNAFSGQVTNPLTGETVTV